MPFGLKKVVIDDVSPGMVLANDLVSTRGIVMLSAGTELTELAIERIKCWGFVLLDIVENNDCENNSQLIAKHEFTDKYTNLVEKVK